MNIILPSHVTLHSFRTIANKVNFYLENYLFSFFGNTIINFFGYENMDSKYEFEIWSRENALSTFN